MFLFHSKMQKSDFIYPETNTSEIENWTKIVRHGLHHYQTMISSTDKLNRSK